jgi:polyhydroxyalkanoate synthesis regulator phasin
MSEERKRDADPFRDGVRAVTGVLGALKDAIEETFDELRERGDISPERAREAARSTVKKAQEAVDDVRGRLDFVSRREFDDLRAEVEALRLRLDAHTRARAAAADEGAPDGAGTSGATAGQDEHRDRWAGSPGAGGGTGSPGGTGGTGSPGGAGGTGTGTGSVDSPPGTRGFTVEDE